MLSTQELFGEQVPFDLIASCRVNRLRVQVGGIQTAIARVALGGQRTQVWLTLTDGRTLSALARDDPRHAASLEQFLDELDRDRAHRWLAALARGETVTVGKVTFTRDVMQVGRKRLAWRDVGGWSMREGGFMVDGPNHRMVFNLWIASTPWVGAIANMLEALAPGKNYAQWPASALPRVGFTATSALTHVPGALTMRMRGYILLALLAIPLIGFAGYSIWYSREEARMHEHYTRSAREEATKLAPRLADPAFADIEACKPTEYGRVTTYLVGVRGGGPSAPLTRGGTPVSELDTYPNDLLIWDVVDGAVRGLLLTDRLGSSGEKLCRATTPGTELPPLLRQLEVKASDAAKTASAEPSPSASPSNGAPPAAPTSPDERASAIKPARNLSAHPSSTSSLTPEAIRATVGKHQSQIRFCYEKALVSNPELAGRIDVKLVIGSSGTPKTSTQGSSTLPASVRTCVLKAFSGMKFPASAKTTTVVYPIVFAPT